MKKKMGRPPMETGKKDFMLRMRMNDEDLAKLDECAKTLGLSRSETLRKGIDTMLKDKK